MRVLVTGAGGMLGWHLRCRLKADARHAVHASDKAGFADDALLAEQLRDCDAVVHLAGVNRGDDEELFRTNIALAERLVEFCDRTEARPHLLFSSSTHQDRDTAYGRSKRHVDEVFSGWAARNGALYTSLVLPNVFGEGGRPYYNSVVHTFCHQAAHGEPLTVRSDAEMDLMHAQDVADLVCRVLEGREAGVLRPAGRRVSVAEVARRVEAIRSQYERQVVPDLRDPIDLALFNTYRHFLFPERFPTALELRTDQRGGLFECVRTLNGGQCFVSGTVPGVTRGNHYHLRKYERFVVLRGRATIRIRRLFGADTHSFEVDGERPVFIDMPALHTHNITNTGSAELVTLFWAHEFFDPAASDTFPEQV